MFREFKDFIMRGNVLDLAVAVIIGTAFGEIVNSLVKDVLMPPLGLILGRVNFGDLFISLNGQAYPSLKSAVDAGAPTITYGLFLQSAINFLILAYVIFMVIRMANRFHPLSTALVPEKVCPYCQSSISSLATRCPHCTSQLEAT